MQSPEQAMYNNDTKTRLHTTIIQLIKCTERATYKNDTKKPEGISSCNKRRVFPVEIKRKENSCVY